MDYKKLELKLRRIVEKRLGEGWEVQATGMRGMINDHQVSCCLVGAIGIDAGINSASFSSHLAAEHVGVPVDVLFSVEKGFDGGRSFYFAHDEDAIAVGARIRRIYCDDNGQVE